MSRGTPRGVKLLSCLLSAKERTQNQIQDKHHQEPLPLLKKIAYILNLSSGLPVPVGVHAACATIGETVGEIRPAGDDLSGNRGLVILPRLQSRKQPFRMGLDEN